MSQGHFAQAAFANLNSMDKSSYTGPRFAPVGNQVVGDPFPLYNQGAYMFTDYTPAGQTSSNQMRQMNIASNNTLARNTLQKAGVAVANSQNVATVFRTQTLGINGDPIACVSDKDCSAWPGTTCNTQFSSWNDSYGNQGNYCSTTYYPELASGTYSRKLTNEGGIGKGCNTDRDCGENYFCNNETDPFGKNIQQTGYCSMIYDCGDGKRHYLGTPYNSGIPITPSSEQNNHGRGYDTQEECVQNIVGVQQCTQDQNGRWFAVYPALCPVPNNLRSGSNPRGQLARTSTHSLNSGITMPGYVNTQSSSITKPLSAFASWNINAEADNMNSMQGPLDYELSINPR